MKTIIVIASLLVGFFVIGFVVPRFTTQTYLYVPYPVRMSQGIEQVRKDSYWIARPRTNRTVKEAKNTAVLVVLPQNKGGSLIVPALVSAQPLDVVDKKILYESYEVNTSQGKKIVDQKDIVSTLQWCYWNCDNGIAKP